jgi:type IV pilus assembly protein PilA
MMSDAFPLIFLLLAVFIILPLLVHFPIYIYRFFRMRRIAREKGPQFRPSIALLALNIWLIIVLLSLTLAVPNFLRFNTRAMQAEARMNLWAIFTAQMAYYGETNTYAGRSGENGSGAFTDMGWAPQGNTRYAYYAGGDYIAPTRPEITIPYRPGESWIYPIRPEASGSGFTVIAVGNVDGDPCLDVWMINDEKQLTNLVNDTNDQAMPGMGAQCGETSAASVLRYKVIESGVVKIFLAFLGLFALTSPLMIFVIPAMYYLGIKQNRLYVEAVAAMAENEQPHL